MDIKIVAIVPPGIAVELKEATEGVQVFEVRQLPAWTCKPLVKAPQEADD